MASIQSRLASALAASLLVLFLVLWLFVSTGIQNVSEGYISTRLQHDIETLLTALSFDAENKIVVNDKYINTIYKRPFSGHYYSIVHGSNEIRSRSLWDQTLITPADIAADYIKTYQPGPENQSLILLSAGFEKQNQKISIHIAEDLTPIRQTINSFKQYFTLFSLSMLIVLLLVQFVILRKGLRPLRKIQHDLRRLEKGDIKKLSSDVADELAPVVKQINQLSSALQKRLKRSRDALSDLSHAIKKPLTVLKYLSDQQSSELNAETKDTLNSQVESLQQITDRILKRARVAGNSKQHREFKLYNELQSLIKTISMMYPDKRIAVETRLDRNLAINTDREDMLEILGNLLDNAWKWAESKIIITADMTQTLNISIEDDGSGDNAVLLNEVMDRGVRLDEAVSGYGFGLAISSDIIRDYKGSLRFSQSQLLGGFKAEITLAA
ncbi:MAG: sensor histidine kinase [Gammaproteobacteria bacterium]|nr:sensor histidine kinase [Gammaproteobacteria bacterium]